MEASYLSILEDEFNGVEESFVFQLRIYRYWDKDSFSNLKDAMRSYLRANSSDDLIPRWVAQLFWYIPHFAREWTSHPSWVDTIAREPEYYHSVYDDLDSLAVWFFTGTSPESEKRSFPNPI